MAHYSGHLGSSSSMCDYCHQQPKFPCVLSFCLHVVKPIDVWAGFSVGRTIIVARPVVPGLRLLVIQIRIPARPLLCARYGCSLDLRSEPLIRHQQCGQRQAFKGHQFCGKKCASTWQAVYGPINPNSYGSSQPQYGQRSSWHMVQPQTKYPPSNPTQTFSGLSQVTGNYSGGFASQNPRPQPPRLPQQPQPQPLRMPQQPQPPRLHQQPSLPSLSLMHQVPGHISPSSMIPPPVRSMSSGMSGPTSPYYTPSTSPSNQDPNANGRANIKPSPSPPLPPIPHPSNQSSTQGQNTNTAANLPIYSLHSSTQPADMDFDAFDDPPETPNGSGGSISAQVQAQTQISVRTVSPHMGSEGDGNGGFDPNDPAVSSSLQYLSNSSNSSVSSLSCRLDGCNKPAFVDQAGNQSEYCSQRHRESVLGFLSRIKVY